MKSNNPPKRKKYKPVGELTQLQRQNHRESQRRSREKKHMKEIITNLGKLDPPKEIEYFKGDNRHTGKFTKVLQLSEVGDLKLYGSRGTIHGAIAFDKDKNYVVVEKGRIKADIPVFV